MPILMPAISNGNSWQKFHSLRVSDRNQERMRSIFFTIKNELGPDHTYVSNLSGCSNPELHGFFVGHVHDKLFGCLVINSLSLNVLDVTSVTKLCQAKTSDIFQGKCPVPKVLMQLTVFSSKVVNGFSVKENRDVTFNAEPRVKIVRNMCSYCQ